MADNERDYGQESIEILLQVMENQREDLLGSRVFTDNNAETPTG